MILMGKKGSSIVKCEGRFHEIREYLFNEILPVVLEDRTKVTSTDLENAWEFLIQDIHRFDLRDPYFNDAEYYTFNPDTRDSLRSVPPHQALSLVPLIADSLTLEEDLVGKYAVCRGNSLGVTKRLEQLSCSGIVMNDFLAELKSVLYFPLEKKKENISFHGYSVGSTFGVGSIVPGGAQEGGIRGDAPFLLGVYDLGEGKRGLNLAGVVGFWAQNDRMLISQIQSCKNAQYPQGVHFGMGSIAVAEQVAKGVGLKGVDLYAAKNHPIFKEHPEDRERLIKDFTCLLDCSAKALGYDGTRGTSYSKTFQ